MRQQAHKRSRKRTKIAAIAAALALAGGGTAIVAANAMAGSGQGDQAEAGDPAQTIACPDVSIAMGNVPDSARARVAEGLTQLDQQVAGAYQKLSSQSGEKDAVLSQLKQERGQTIGRMMETIAQTGAQRPQKLESMTDCSMQQTGQAATVQDDQAGQQDQEGQDQGQVGQDQGQDGGEQGGDQGGDQGGGAAGGPVAEDFVDINKVQPNVQEQQQEGGSDGTFTSDCGRNENGKFNSDNVIVAPGVGNGAHHVHDYVGNQANDAFASDDDLAKGDTTCKNGDQSTHYWPVLRVTDENPDEKGNGAGPGGAQDGNVGTVLTPASVKLTLKGNAKSDVTAMPRFLRIITGDAKAFTNGTANANASWSCEGFEDRQLKDKYPICPDGADVVRTFNFQNCWDGQNTDSGNHRDHVAFAEDDGSCPNGFKAIPQLQQKITFDVPDAQESGAKADAPFAVDSFPEQLHKPVTDHGDFINVMPDDLMNKAVDCINSGQDCT